MESALCLPRYVILILSGSLIGAVCCVLLCSRRINSRLSFSATLSSLFLFLSFCLLIFSVFCLILSLFIHLLTSSAFLRFHSALHVEVWLCLRGNGCISFFGRVTLSAALCWSCHALQASCTDAILSFLYAMQYTLHMYHHRFIYRRSEFFSPMLQ